ncbi:hypothetical protein ACFQ6B_01325 [Streptomyces wedmorensis]|uniref:PknH-like extracellular domain-containing protein n=1 Tax=Streptomyces wedmorensis TaxID=43759 RepID=A0ABW6IPX9_STRWE
MSRNRRSRHAVLAGAGLLAALAVYGVSQQATASATDTDAQAPAATTAPTAPTAASTTEAPAPSRTAPAATGTGAPAPARPGAPTRTTAPAPAAAPTGGATGKPAPGTTAPAPLKPAELPDGERQEWKPMGEVMSLPLSGDFQLNECVSVAKATAWHQQGFRGSTRDTVAVQDTLTFPDEATAAAAYRTAVGAMKDCQATSRELQRQAALPQDAAVRQTANTADGTSWQRRWTGVQGISSPGDQANHVYAVQRGNVLALLHYDEPASASAAPSYDFRGDTAVLRTLGALLAK